MKGFRPSMFGLDQDPIQVIGEFLKVTTSLSTERDLRRLLDMIVRSARTLTRAEAGRVYLLDHLKRNLCLEVSQNECLDSPTAHLPEIPLMVGDKRNEQSLCAHCVLNGRLVNVPDVYQYTGFDCSDLYRYDRFSGYRTRSVLVAPLRNHAGLVIGALELLNMRDRDSGELVAFPAEVERMVEAFASQAAVAVDNVQLIDQRRQLIEALDQANQALEKENRELKQRIRQPHRFPGIIGASAAMGRVFHLMEKIFDSDATVLLRGETGTGKELVAAAIHRHSTRSKGAFVAQNCAALPKELLESELFGYRKGAFTGAVTDKQGLLEMAHRGTLFLDEIADMPVELQAKLLRVLQEGEVRPLGSLQSRKVDVRVVAATHQDLQTQVTAGRFREDLYYRLCVFPIELPPLRERKEDLPALLEHFVCHHAERCTKEVSGFSPAAFEALLQYDYPGNVRELRNIVERAVLLCEKGGCILPEHLPEDVTDALCAAGDDGPTQPAAHGGLRELVGCFEASLIKKKLCELDGNQTQTAKALHISRRALIDKINKYRLQEPGGR